MTEVEPIRLSVNRLLDGADPILADFHNHRLDGSAAARRMNRLEHAFAQYTVDIAAVEPHSRALAHLHADYAGTYAQEDAYLSALVAGLSSGDLGNLPNTQAEQRAAIIRWRTGLAVFAHKANLALPGDLALAGRGEIAPSARGAS